MLQALAHWLLDGALKMVRAALGTLRERTKRDHMHYCAEITIAVPLGAPSSPVYFNIYINDLAA